DSFCVNTNGMGTPYAAAVQLSEEPSTVEAVSSPVSKSSSEDRSLPGAADLQLDHVVEVLRSLDPDGSRFALVLRETLDHLLDGERTGRYRESELRKTERAHIGALAEINLHRAFSFDDGSVTDYRIAGIEVDCEFARDFGGWEI